MIKVIKHDTESTDSGTKVTCAESCCARRAQALAPSCRFGWPAWLAFWNSAQEFREIGGGLFTVHPDKHPWISKISTPKRATQQIMRDVCILPLDIRPGKETRWQGGGGTEGNRLCSCDSLCSCQQWKCWPSHSTDSQKFWGPFGSNSVIVFAQN